MQVHTLYPETRTSNVGELVDKPDDDIPNRLFRGAIQPCILFSVKQDFNSIDAYRSHKISNRMQRASCATSNETNKPAERRVSKN